MRLAIVCSATYGGSGVVATELGKALAARGHEVHFISAAMPFRLDPAPTKNIFFHEVQTMDYPVLQGELYTISLASKIVQVAQDHGLDLVHAHYAIPHTVSSWLASETLRSSSKPLKVVTTLHGTDITLVGRAPSFYPIIKFAMEKSDAITTVSSWLRDETIREFAFQQPIDVIPNFVDEQVFRKLPDCTLRSWIAPNGEKILMHVSNFRPVKRIPDVVKTFALVRREMPAKLVMIGDGPERDCAQRLARSLHVQQDVHFLGKQEHIEKYYSCADLLLFPSEYESFGLAALEAMAAETVVVASNGGGLPEVIRHGIDGFMANVGDVETMADLAVQILRDDVRRKAMGREARKSAMERFHPAEIVPMYERLYERVLASEPAATVSPT